MYEGERKTYTREFLYPTMHHPPLTTPHPGPWRHQTGNVTDKQADFCSPTRRRLLCLSGGIPETLCAPSSRWRWDSTDSCEDPTCLTMVQWNGGGKVSQKHVEQLITAHQSRILLDTRLVFQASRLGSDFWMGTLISKDILHRVPTTHRPVRRAIFLTFVFLLLWWHFVGYTSLAFWWCLIWLPVYILLYCGILRLLSKRDAIRSVSDHQLSMLLQFSEKEKINHIIVTARFSFLRGKKIQHKSQILTHIYRYPLPITSTYF